MIKWNKATNLFIFIIFIFISTTCATKNLLLIFRPRSRHTSHFYPLDAWSLPHYELHSVLKSQGIEMNLQHLNSYSTHVYTYKLEGIIDSNQLSKFLAVCSQCVLLHSVYELWSEGCTAEETAESALLSRFWLEPQHPPVESWSTTLTVMDQQWLSREDMNQQWLSKFIKVWEKCFLGRELARGLAVGTPNRRSGMEPFPRGGASRRPVVGILKTLEMHRLPFPSRTILPSEIALLMANFANVGGSDTHTGSGSGSGYMGKKVLDPYCGCGGLLSAVSYLQHRHRCNDDYNNFNDQHRDISNNLFGIDINLNETEINANFEHFHLSAPKHLMKYCTLQVAKEIISNNNKLHGGTDHENDIENEYLPWILKSHNKFDAIITDPPQSIEALLTIGEEMLVSGGRLVFLMPHWDALNECCDTAPLPPLPPSLKLIIAIRQDFSRAFSRWLDSKRKILGQWLTLLWLYTRNFTIHNLLEPSSLKFKRARINLSPFHMEP
eukprot:gene4531-8995_t